MGIVQRLGFHEILHEFTDDLCEKSREKQIFANLATICRGAIIGCMDIRTMPEAAGRSSAGQS